MDELTSNPKAAGIKIELADIKNLKRFKKIHPELIVCCGDTITHLEDKQEISKLITDASDVIIKKGHLVVSFRDYSAELDDKQRFIPVKSSANRILTCVLEYEKEKVKVTDLFHERINDGWIQKVSSYEKVRISINEILNFIEMNQMKVLFNAPINRMQTIIAQKMA